MRKYILTLLIVSAVCSFSYAVDRSVLLKKIADSNSRTDLSYDYRMELFDSKGLMDSTSGKLYLSNGQYIDSNNMKLTTRIGNFFCEFNHEEHTAAVIDVRALSAKIGVRLKNNTNKFLFNITEQVLQRSGGDLTIDSDQAEVFSIIARLKLHAIEFVKLTVDRNSCTIRSAEIQIKQSDGGNSIFKTRLLIYNFHYEVNKEIFDNDRFFRVDRGRIVLPGKYHNYAIVEKKY